MATISYSSSLLLSACEQKYAHHKILRTKRDYPFETSRALVVGKAVHEVAEELLHLPPETDAHLEKIVVKKLQEFELENPEALSYFAVAFAMVRKYLKFHAMSGLEVVKCEHQLKSDNFLGYIDIILKDPTDNSWYIADLKTKARFDLEKDGPMLDKDLQLNLYSSFKDELQEEFGLGEFKGTLYRVVKTPLIRQKKGESKEEFFNRLKDVVEVVQVYTPYVEQNVKEVMEFFDKVLDTKEELEQGRVPTRNYSECINKFGSVCPWYSQCYGKEFETASQEIKYVTYEEVELRTQPVEI